MKLKKESRRWKVFLIVLIMLFTMMPANVFAAEPTDETQISQTGASAGDPANPETPPDETPPDETPPDEIPPDTTSPSALSDPETTTDGATTTDPETTTGGITIDVTPTGGPMKAMFNGTCPPPPSAPATLGSIMITKKIVNDPGTNDTFTFDVSRWSKSRHKWVLVDSITINGAGTVTVDNLAAGEEYKVKEVDIPDPYVATDDETDKFRVGAGSVVPVTFTNTYSKGTITINKEVLGNPGSTDTFTFNVYKWNQMKWKWDLVETPSINGSGSAIVKDLSYYWGAATYKIVEDAVTNYQAEQSVFTITISSCDPHQQVTFRNTYTEPTTGAITITKQVRSNEDVTVPSTVFTFNLIGPDGYVKPFQLDNGDNSTITIPNLTPGAYVVTEAAINGFTPEENDYEKDVIVVAGTTATVPFTNIFDPGVPAAWVTKSVAPYSGSGVPAEGAFASQLGLTELNKTVIYKISFSCNEAWNLAQKSAVFNDEYHYNNTNRSISEMFYWDSGLSQFVPVGAIGLYYPVDFDKPLYFIDSLPSYGTYNNTAYLYDCSGAASEAPVLISSASAVVTVTEPTHNGGDGGSSGRGGGDSISHYVVTYNSNFPGVAGTGGMVPVDSKRYPYNDPVNVKGNTGDLKAGDYIFKGWNTKPDGTGTMYQSGSVFNIKADTVLYAIWEAAANETTQQTQTSTEPQPSGATSANDSELDNVPKTGDTTPLLLMFLLGVLSIAGIIFFGRRKIFEFESDK